MLFFSCRSQFEVHKTWTLINVIFKRWKIAVICMYFSLSLSRSLSLWFFYCRFAAVFFSYLFFCNSIFCLNDFLCPIVGAKKAWQTVASRPHD